MKSALVFTFHKLVVEGRPQRGKADRVSQSYDVQSQIFLDLANGIQENGCCTVSDFLSKREGSWRILTFDDGFESDYAIAFPALKARNVRATFFITLSNIGKPGYTTIDQITNMAKTGMEIGSHGLRHQYLVTMTRSEALKEIRDSKKELEERLGKKVTSFAPVGGHFRKWMVQAAREAGYEAFATMIPGRTCKGGRFIQFRRNHIQTHHDCNYIAALLSEDKRLMLKNLFRYYLLQIPKMILGMRSYDRIKGLIR